MRYGFFSDIHGKTQVLRRLLTQLADENIERLIVLGDIGGDAPCDVLRRRGIQGTFGNYEVSGYGSLSPANRNYVMALSPVLAGDDFLAAHAVPYHPAGLTNVADFSRYKMQTGVKWRALFPYPSAGDEVLWHIYTELRSRAKRIFFHGHTHYQQAWMIDASLHLAPIHARQFAVHPDQYYIVGVGSVGEPEAGEPPGYAVYDDEAGVIELRNLQGRA